MNEPSKAAEEPRHVDVRHAFNVLVLDTTLIPALKQMGITAELCYVPDPGAETPKEDSVFLTVKTQKGAEIIVAERWKQGNNRAEEYLPNDAIKLIHALKTSNGRFHKGYLVLGGPGWSKGDIALSKALGKYIVDFSLIQIITLDKFLRLVSKKAL